MSIAQHFGVPTPLLDWSQSIFAALFFAVRDVFADSEFEESLMVYVYHIIDKRLLHDGIPDDRELSEFGRSAFVKPYHIDRRIERQRGVFTCHPHPSHQPPKVPARVYVLEWFLIKKQIDLMKGFGFTEDYFFPDYAGIAHTVMSDTGL
jgi:FRG domain-containing protein